MTEVPPPTPAAAPASGTPSGTLPPRKVIFVGGAPRSGTSVTHALLCTAQATNRYHPEISFVRPVLESWVTGMEKWQGHTCAFFLEPDHLTLQVRGLLQQQMSHVARVLGCPEVLCVKDPLLTPHFAAMQAVLGWPVQFVTVLRHPHNVVRSLQEVVEREGKDFTPDLVQFAAYDYLNSYAHLADPALSGALHAFRYEDLGQPATLAALRSFTGLADIDPAGVWEGGAHTPTPEELADPWYSPKYHGPIDTQSRLSPLAPRICHAVNAICEPLMIRFGYSPYGGTEIVR